MTSGDVQPTLDWSGDDVRCAVVELRQYALRHGQRDVLIELFDRALVETQEAVGMTVLGQFRDVDDPDRFVWLRGFPDMGSRRVSLEAFYRGPVWAAHGHAAAATMVDSDDVLLLRPFQDRCGFKANAARRPPPGARGDGPGLVVATIVLLDRERAGEVPLGDAIVGALTDAGTRFLGAYETEPAPNTFPRLPVRETDTAFVWFAAYDNERAHHRADEALATDPTWSGTVAPLLHSPFVRQTSQLRLIPTARSRIIGSVRRRV